MKDLPKDFIHEDFPHSSLNHNISKTSDNKYMPESYYYLNNNEIAVTGDEFLEGRWVLIKAGYKKVKGDGQLIRRKAF